MKKVLLAVSALALFAGPALARDQIRIVGSSTVYPFTTTVAENFGKTSGMKTPVVESTGTGGGMKVLRQRWRRQPGPDQCLAPHQEERI